MKSKVLDDRVFKALYDYRRQPHPWVLIGHTPKVVEFNMRQTVRYDIYKIIDKHCV